MSLEDLNAAPETEAPAPAPSEPAPAQAAPAESPADKAEAAERALDDDLRATFRNANKAREEDGKFAAKDGKPAEAQPEAEAKPVEAPKVEAPLVPVVPPPASWKKEAAAEWDKLPPTVQQYVAQRETEAHTAISQLGQYAKNMQPIGEVIQPHVDRIRAAGDNPAGYVQKLFAADQWLARDPVGAIKALAQNYQVDLNAIADPFSIGADPHQQQMTSQLNAAWQEIDNLKRQLGDTHQRVVGRESHEQAIRQSSYEHTVSEFAADKPDFGDLADEIEHAIPAIRRSNPNLSPKEMLNEAYERARWANPTTRTKLIEAQRAEAEKKRFEEAKTAANTARRSAAINVNGSAPVGKQMSLDDDLSSIWRRNHAN